MGMDRIGPSKPIRWYVREWRAAKGLTQAQLANRLDTSSGVVSDLENGKRRMNEAWMAEIAWALGVEPADLLRDPAQPTFEERMRAVSPADRAIIESIIARITTAA
jgi:transcriptional regulator with XRE-family HTH domain